MPDFAARVASPQMLYRFEQGGKVHTFTNRVTPFTYGGELYLPRAICHSGIERTLDPFKSEIKIELNRDNELALSFLPRGDGVVVKLKIYRKSGASVALEWAGRVTSCVFGAEKFSLSCSASNTGLTGVALPRRYQRMCPYALYGHGCGVNKESFTDGVNVTAVNGPVVTAPHAALKPNGYYTGGILRTIPGYQRLIIGHTGQTLTLMSAIPQLFANMAVNIIAGCDHTVETCDSKFSNLNNFGGQPWIPSRNPFEGSIIDG